jgi:hypothetical protein
MSNATTKLSELLVVDNARDSFFDDDDVVVVVGSERCWRAQC